MMKKAIHHFSLLFFLFFTAIVSAAENTHAPSCPNPKMIKAIVFKEAQKGDTTGVWTLKQSLQDNQNQMAWEISVMVEANDQASALKKGKQTLSHLRKIRGPEKVENIWVCDYQSKYALMVTAMAK